MTANFQLTRPAPDTLLLQLAGEWTMTGPVPEPAAVRSEIAADARIKRLQVDASRLEAWDSSLLTFLLALTERDDGREFTLDQGGLPQGAQRLLRLATAVPERQGARREVRRPSWLHRIGDQALEVGRSCFEMLVFLGSVTLAFLRMLIGRARYRRSDLFLVMQESGIQALPIVSLISLLIGLILAFVGAKQLQMFGAQIYVANLVGIGMAWEMGAMMTGIIMAGRTGAAFAAQLGTMQVNEEIDALETLGLSPLEFLVLPRMLALILMMPLLCLYADFVGILGGLLVGVGLLHLTPEQYYQQTVSALRLTDFGIGLFKSAVFGVIVAVAGCMRGMQCGRSAQAVGVATTSAVVTAIVLIVVADSIITVICNVLSI